MAQSPNLKVSKKFHDLKMRIRIKQTKKLVKYSVRTPLYIEGQSQGNSYRINFDPLNMNNSKGWITDHQRKDQEVRLDLGDLRSYKIEDLKKILPSLESKLGVERINQNDQITLRLTLPPTDQLQSPPVLALEENTAIGYYKIEIKSDL